MATQNIYALTDTWNAGGTTFTAIGMNVTDTASAAGSLLLNLQVGGVSQFKVSKAGAATITTIELGNASDTTLSRSSAGVLAVEGVAVPTISSSDTLSNKTLSSPTLSGTVAGNPTFSGTPNFGGGAFFTSGGRSIYIRQASSLNRIDSYNDPITATVPLSINSSQLDLVIADTVKATLISTGITLADAYDMVVGTTTGTKIGTATNQKLGFFNKTPVVQPTAVADATDAASAITQLNALLSRMRDLGLIAT